MTYGRDYTLYDVRTYTYCVRMFVVRVFQCTFCSVTTARQCVMNDSIASVGRMKLLLLLLFQQRRRIFRATKRPVRNKTSLVSRRRASTRTRVWAVSHITIIITIILQCLIAPLRLYNINIYHSFFVYRSLRVTHRLTAREH